MKIYREHIFLLVHSCHCENFWCLWWMDTDQLFFAVWEEYWASTWARNVLYNSHMLHPSGYSSLQRWNPSSLSHCDHIRMIEEIGYVKKKDNLFFTRQNTGPQERFIPNLDQSIRETISKAESMHYPLHWNDCSPNIFAYLTFAICISLAAHSPNPFKSIFQSLWPHISPRSSESLLLSSWHNLPFFLSNFLIKLLILILTVLKLDFGSHIFRCMVAAWQKIPNEYVGSSLNTIAMPYPYIITKASPSLQWLGLVIPSHTLYFWSRKGH